MKLLFRKIKRIAFHLREVRLNQRPVGSDEAVAQTIRVNAADFHAAMERGTHSKEACAEVTRQCLNKLGQQ